MKVIAVVGLKGGSGKTSTTVPLAAEASRRGVTVILDMDSTPSSMQWLDAAGLTSEQLAGVQVEAQGLSQMVADLRESGEVAYVVIDTPPLREDVCVAASALADLVIIPMHIGSGDIAQVRQTVELLQLRPGVPALVLLNHAGTMPAVTRLTREALDEFGIRMADTEIPYRAIYIMAKGNRPNADWWHFEKLWRELEELL